MSQQNELPIDNLDKFKKQVQYSHQYWMPNADRFDTVRSFLFATTIAPMEDANTQDTARPVLECPILEPMISRVCEEFYKNRPDPKVSAAAGRPEDPEQIRIIEGIIRHLDDEMNMNHNVDYRAIEAAISGGYSAVKVYDDYEHDMSLDLTIKTNLTFNETLTYWDPNSTEDDKRDGQYCGEIFPLYDEEFYEQFPDAPRGEMKFEDSIEGFQWSYKNLDRKIILVVEHYVKVFKNVEIVKLSNGQVLTRTAYNKLLKRDELLGISITPAIIQKRKTRRFIIMKYTFCGARILREEETDYDDLPIIYVDGNSKVIRQSQSGSAAFMTRPLIYPAMDIQRLKNVSMQSIANELENVQQSQFMFPKEAIPTKNIDEWTNPQLAASLPYNQFLNNDPNVPLNKPEVVHRRPFPPEYLTIFKECDLAMQQIFGAYQGGLAKAADRDLSGKALKEIIDVSNSSCAPYFISYLKYKQAWCNRVLARIPKLFNTERTIPILTADGKKEYVLVNAQGGISLQYEPSAMNVKVMPGANFKIQKERAYDAYVRTMQASPEFAAFMNSKGLAQLIDNMPEIRGLEELKQSVAEWQQEMQMMKQQQAQKPDPATMMIQVEAQKNQARAQLDIAKLQQEATQQQVENQLEMAQLLLDKQKLEAELAETQARLNVDIDKAETDKIMKAAELAIKKADQQMQTSIERQKQLETLINYETEMKYLELENKKLNKQEKKELQGQDK